MMLYISMKFHENILNTFQVIEQTQNDFFCVCIEVLRPRQLYGTLSNAVSLPNHTFTGKV